ncbi:MAG: lipase maturation factor family protein [Candidatus Margulisiibacteriota bacterium]
MMETLTNFSRSLGVVFSLWYDQEFWLTRFIFLRALGLIYLVAFLGVLFQFKGLFGRQGLLPAHLFLERVTATYGSGIKAFWSLPTVFLINISDHFMAILAFLGVILSTAVLFGLSNGVSLFVLWVIYLSFVHVGQVFYGFGWESLLLETGFLAIFLYPFFNLNFFPIDHPPPKIIMFLLVWILFRNMFGAGLIKLRGDASWKDLTALIYHFETQPLPNPLSPLFHALPKWMLKGGVLFNHFVELLVPIGLLLTAPFRMIAGIFTSVFQLILIISGNLSWLNWLTLVLCIPCFDDRIWRRILPASWLKSMPIEHHFGLYAFSTQLVLVLLAVTIGILSINPIKNFFSSRQRMNSSYDPFHLVNSYGAFGSVGKKRYECIIMGTHDLNSDQWQPYEFVAKPGDVLRPHPIIAPYQPRLDWQIWFAAMGSYQQHPWLVHLVYKLLQNDAEILALMASNPFQDVPPKYIKIDLYEYQLAPLFSGRYWDRTYVSSYLPPLSLDNESFLNYLNSYGWISR